MDETVISLMDETEIAHALCAQVINPTGRRYAQIATDSRNAEQDALFAALKGERFDAHDFVPAAAEAGCRGAIVSRIVNVPDDFTLFAVDDVLKAFGRLAKAILQKRRTMGGFRTFAVTGSNGKTTTKEILASLLEFKGHHVLKTAGNFNNFVGLPMTVSRLRTSHDTAVLEMGTNAPGEIRYLADIAQPEIGIITSIGTAHVGMFGAMDGVASAKGELLMTETLCRAVLPAECFRAYYHSNPETAEALAKMDVRLVESVHLPETNAPIAISVTLNGTDLTFHDIGSADRNAMDWRVKLPLLGAHNAHNFMMAFEAVYDEYTANDDLTQAVSSVQLPSGRLERWMAPNGVCLLHDAYNANPTSMTASLHLLKEISAADNRCFILGTMAELGENSAQYHREAGRMAGNIGGVCLLCVGSFGENYRDGAIEAGFPNSRILCVDAEDLNRGVEWMRPFFKSGMVCLVKGSRSVRLERVLETLGGCSKVSF